MNHRRLTLCSLAILLVSISACATGASWSSRQQKTASDVDASRAFLSLNQIEPRVTTPPRSLHADPPSDRAVRQIRKARELMAEARYTEAAIELERALRYDPKHPLIHRTLATLHWEAGNIVRARTHASRALELEPDDAVAHYILGRAHRVSSDAADALTALRTALRCSNIDNDLEVAALTHYHLAQTLEGEGYLTAALSQYELFEHKTASLVADIAHPELATLRQAGGRTVRAARADLLEQIGRFAEAADALAPLVEAAHDDVVLGCRHARLLMKADRLKAALAAAGRLPLRDKDVVELLFEIHRASGHGDRIVDDLSAYRTRNPDDVDSILHLADMLTRLGRSEEAADTLRTFLETNPDQSAVREALIGVYTAQADWTRLIRTCAEAIDRDATQATGLERRVAQVAADKDAVRVLLAATDDTLSPTEAYLRGVVAQAAGRLEDAHTWLRSGYDRAPNLLPARVALAQLLLRLYRYDEAIQLAERSDDPSDQDARLEFLLGRVYERLDDIRKAERHFQAAIQLDRQNSDAMMELAALYQRSGQRLQARRLLGVLLDQDPHHEAAREMLVATHLEEGRLDVAVEQLEALKQRAKAPLVRARCLAFLGHLKQQDTAEYRRLLLEAMDRYGPDADTWVAVAQSFDPDQETEPRRHAFSRAIQIDSDNEEAALGLVDTSRRLLDFEQAAVRLEDLMRRRPNRHTWRVGYEERIGSRATGQSQRWLGLIELYWVIQDYEKALQIARAGEATPELDDAVRSRYRRMLVDTYHHADRDEEALTQVKTWADADKDDRDLTLFLASEYLRSDKAALAVPIVEAIQAETPSWHNLLNVVRALVADERHDRASQFLLDYLDSDPENDATVTYLADILSGSGRVDDGLEFIRSHLLHTMDRESSQTLMVGLLRRAGRFEDAHDLVDALIDEVMTLWRGDPDAEDESIPTPTTQQRTRLPNEPFSVSRLRSRMLDLRDFQIQLLVGDKDFDTAHELLAEWLEAARGADERFGYLRYLAICHRANQDEEKANEVLQRALLLRPQNITLNNDVAYAWIDEGLHLVEAERMVRFSLSRSPLQGAYLDTYGWLLYKKGEFDDARKWLERANHAQRRRDPVIMDHLGDVLWRLGRPEKSVQAWKKSLEILKGRDADQLLSADEKRVRDTTKEKIDDVQAKRRPGVAPIATEQEKKDEK